MNRPTEHHYVTFYSPGAFISEETTKPVTEWSPREAMQLASAIIERHGARPFGFRFFTRIVADDIDDGYGGTLQVTPKTVRSSGMYFIGGRVFALEDVEREEPDNHILIGNLKRSGQKYLIQGPTIGPQNWKWTHLFPEDANTVDADGNVLPRP